MVEIKVYGIPAPQGSKKFVGIHNGHGIMAEDCSRTRPWREAIKWACLQAGKPHTAGPVVMEMIFTMPKPKSAPKKRKTWPATKPDVSKLARATEDALTQIGFYEDDARIVGYQRLYKVYPGEDPDALASPGCVIRCWPMGGTE